MTLTREEKRVRIAEACGAKIITKRFPSGIGKKWAWNGDPSTPCGHKFAGGLFGWGWGKDACSSELPDYFSSLDACYEMEKVMNKEQVERYGDILSNTPQTQEWAGCTMWHFTAEDKAEAFGLALGLWQPGE